MIEGFWGSEGKIQFHYSGSSVEPELDLLADIYISGLKYYRGFKSPWKSIPEKSSKTAIFRRYGNMALDISPGYVLDVLTQEFIKQIGENHGKRRSDRRFKHASKSSRTRGQSS